MTRRVISVSLPEDIARRLDAVLARRGAAGDRSGRSTVIVEALRVHLDHEERGDRATPAGVEVVPGADLIVPTGADLARSHAYRLKITSVVIQSDANGCAHVVGKPFRLDGQPAVRGTLAVAAILDPTRLLPAPEGQ